jgi:hypothetical protein
MSDKYVELDISDLEEDQLAIVNAVINEGALRMQDSLLRKINEKLRSLSSVGSHTDWERGYHSALIFMRQVVAAEVGANDD